MRLEGGNVSGLSRQTEQGRKVKEKLRAVEDKGGRTGQTMKTW